MTASSSGNVTIQASAGSVSITAGGTAAAITLSGGRVVSGNVLVTDTTLDGGYYYVVMNSASTHTVTLPSSPTTWQVYIIKNKGAGTLTIAGNGKNIDGSSSITAAQYVSYTVTYDGTVWNIGD